MIQRSVCQFSRASSHHRMVGLGAQQIYLWTLLCVPSLFIMMVYTDIPERATKWKGSMNWTPKYFFLFQFITAGVVPIPSNALCRITTTFWSTVKRTALKNYSMCIIYCCNTSNIQWRIQQAFLAYEATTGHRHNKDHHQSSTVL